MALSETYKKGGGLSALVLVDRSTGKGRVEGKKKRGSPTLGLGYLDRLFIRYDYGSCSRECEWSECESDGSG